MKIHIPTYYSLLPVLLLLVVACSEDRQISVRAEKALHEVASRYRSEKSIPDSLLDVASSYYLPELAKGDTTLSVLSSSSEQAECMLYEGIRHHDRAQQQKPDMTAYASEIAQAYRFFLEVERNTDLLSSPYLKGIIHNRLALINSHNGNLLRAQNYFRKETYYALQTKDTTTIALAYMHLAYSFYKEQNRDSALFYCNKAFFLATHLEGRVLSALYANTMHLNQFFNNGIDRDEKFLHQLSFQECTRNDSCRIYTIIADYYLNHGLLAEADSLLRWTIIHSDGKPELLSMAYQRQADLFEKMGMADSALCILKNLTEQQELLKQSHLGVELAEAHEQYVQLQHQRHHEHIVITIIIIALLIIVTLLVFWVRRIQQTRRLELRIFNLYSDLDTYIADNNIKLEIINQQNSTILQQQDTITQQNSLIMHQEDAIVEQNKNMKRQQERHEQKETEYVQKILTSRHSQKDLQEKLKISRVHNRSLHSMVASVLRRFYLLGENGPWPSAIYEELLNIYREVSSTRRNLLEELDKIDLSPRQKVICLLINEGKFSPNELWFYSGSINEASFQSTKSQIKQKLVAATSTSKEIQSLLKSFIQERGPSPKQKSQLKNE